MKLCTCFVVIAGLLAGALASVNNDAVEAGAVMKRSGMMRRATKKPTTEEQKPAPKKTTPKKPAPKPKSTPPKTTAPKTTPPKTPAGNTPKPPAQPTTTSTYTGLMSAIQQVQLAAITEYAQQEFVNTSMNMFSDADFAAAGFESKIRFRIQNILSSNAQYLPLYEKFLGANMPKPCTMQWPVASPQDVVEMSHIMEQAAHLARFQTDVTPVLTSNPYGWVTRTNYVLNKGVLHNTVANYIVSCPSAFEGGMIVLPQPVLTPVAGQTPKLGSTYKFNVPAGVTIPSTGAFFYLVSGDQASTQPANEVNGVVSVTLPKQTVKTGKGMTYVSIINNNGVGEYSGPSDENLFTASVPVNAVGEKCVGPIFAC